jgi:hypothetical protein
MTETTITVECLCKKNSFSTKVPSSQLPLELEFCHCNSCRHVTGALYTCECTWPEGWDKVDLSSLKEYSFSPNLKLYFCDKCGGDFCMTDVRPDGHNWIGVFSGLLPNSLCRYSECQCSTR